MEKKVIIPYHDDPHERSYILRDKDGNVIDIAPCYAEEEDDIVKDARAYEQKQKLELEKENKRSAKIIFDEPER